MSPRRFTAKNQGYFRVYVEDTQVSRHTKEREALESAVNAADEFPAARVWYDHDYVVVVQEGAEPEPEPEPEPPPPEPEPEPPPSGAPAGPTNLAGVMVLEP